MKKYTLLLLLTIIFSVFPTMSTAADDFYCNSDGKYTVEIETGTPNTEFAIVVVAGDYAEASMPELTAENIIYMNQMTSDSDGTIVFEEFIPMTGSVGTIFISGKTAPENSGLLMTESGLGYIAGRLISYSGSSEELVISGDITSVDDGVLDSKSGVLRVFIPPSVEYISQNAIACGIKLFLSPKVSSDIIQYAVDNGFAHYLLGDYNNDMTVDDADMRGILSHFASEKEADESFADYFDLNFDGNVNLLDASVLLKYLGGVISDFFL